MFDINALFDAVGYDGPPADTRTDEERAADEAAERRRSIEGARRERDEIAASIQERRKHECRRCGGTGFRPQFSHIAKGKCFTCNGTGDTRREYQRRNAAD